ncbi:hypothetical protein LSM04_000059 [Trypanosoma melophagium]|uniref:uncharacterized protein n=1 Tax=Trypanosoma melophagium TaxID=715481 RepID=UPI00351A3325|nr:hypothetical protein LSM04_000059 [Trypanosoma melophagium]
MEVAHNTSFVNSTQDMWTSYRLSVVSSWGIYNRESQFLPVHIETIHHPNILFKKRKNLQKEVIIITDVCLFIVNNKKTRKIRLMVPLSLVDYVEEMIEKSGEDGTQEAQLTVVNTCKSGSKNLECYFLMNCFNAGTFIEILKRVYETLTIRVLLVVRNPVDSTEKVHPLSMYHQYLRAKKEVRCRTLLNTIKYKTMSFISTLSNVSLMMPENDCQWDFIAVILFSVCKRLGVLRELLRSWLKYEITRAKDILRNHNTTTLQKPHDPFPNEARLLTTLILEVEAEDSGNDRAKNLIGDMFFLQFVARVLRDTGRLGVSIEGFLVTQRKNLNHLVRVTECLFNGTRKSSTISYIFSPSLCGASDEDAIRLTLNSEEIKSFYSENTDGVSRCVDELIAASKGSLSSFYAEFSKGVEEKENVFLNTERELEELNNAIGNYAIHLFADKKGDLWNLMASEQDEHSSMPEKVLNISGTEMTSGDATHREMAQLRVENAKLQIQIQQLREKAEGCEKREFEALNALLQCQRRVEEKSQEMQLSHLRVTRGHLIIPPLPQREELGNGLSTHLHLDDSYYSMVSKTHGLW